MINTLLGQKIEQTQKFLENGKRIPVTQISVPANVVAQVKTVATDGYTAVQIGFGVRKKATKALAGHAKKAGLESAPSVIQEVIVSDDALPTAGEAISVSSVFKPGDIVEVTGTSKGKGFAGVVKRHNFRGGPKTHGQSDRHRAPGSIGQTTTPGRVYRGKRMAGRMGSDTVTVANLIVVDVDEAAGLLLVAGLIPGHKRAIISVTKTGEKKNFVELLGVKAKREAAEAEAARIEAEKAEAQAPKQEEVTEPASSETVSEEPKAEEAPKEEKVEETTTENKEEKESEVAEVEKPAEEEEK